MKNFENLGTFYLGKIVNPKNGDLTDDLLLYDSKNFTTHAVCLGMTGSGKTGLGITILEEAALDKIPAIIIDPKGDLGNLMLTFPSLSPKDFLPWIDPAAAEQKGMDVKDYSETVSNTWKEGLEKWGEDVERIKKLKESTEVVIYTPASNAGIPLSILSSFTAPSKELMLDQAAVRDRILSVTSSLLGLLGINIDPIKSREHILISSIINEAWQKGSDLSLESLIEQVQNPPFSKIGVLDIDTFYPSKDRMTLSINLNNLLASPGFQAWMEGEPLEIGNLLYTPEGKPKLSVITIAHLSDPEKMFFVTLLLNEMLSWMRRQSGTTSLRSILYMDEVFGYFPPISMPPSKIPMLTLLKQARAFGIGIVLATQNPVDLDYKGLANCGTWFIGKLQTERDKSRVLDGLTIASNGEIKTNELNKMLSLTGNRTFIMRSIYLKDPVIFQTRWSMSYLRGPLTLAQIKTLMGDRRITNEKISKTTVDKESVVLKPKVPEGIQEYFIRGKSPVHYRPQIVGMAKLHFVDIKNKIDTWKNICVIAPPEDQTVNWEEGEIYDKEMLENDPVEKCTYEDLPKAFLQKKNYTAFEKSFASFLYQKQSITIYQLPELNILSKEGETEGEFRARASLVKRENRDALIAKIKAKYTEKIATLTERLRKAEEKMSLQKKQWWWQILETTLSFLTTIISALVGRGVTKGTITQTGTSMRRAGRITKENQEASQAEGNYNALQEQLESMKRQMEDEIDSLTKEGIEELNIVPFEIKPRKSDILVEKVALVWVP